jgi:Spy/CpxP family protein refolding chaperone
MRIASKWVLVTAVTLCVAGLASAQNPGGGRGGRGGAGGGQGRGFGGGMGGGVTIAMLLGNEGVQKELKLTDEQKSKVKEFSDAQRAKMAELRPQGGEQPDVEKIRAAMKTASEAGDKFVKETLNADQQKRVVQIKYQAMLQVMGPNALTNDEVVKALTITDDQKDKFKTLGADMNKDRQELMQDARGTGDAATEARKKMTTITKEYTAKAVDALTADQKKTWKDMTGEPVDPTILQMQGGRGGRGGAAGGAGGRGGRGGNNPPPPV